MSGELYPASAPPSADQLYESVEPAPPASGHGGVSGARRLLARLLRAALRKSPLGRDIIWSLPPASSSVILTFDDGPDPHWTPRVLEILARHHASASFFLIGGKASEQAELVRQIQAGGHSLGSHTQSHVDLRRMPPGEARREIAEADRTIGEIAGQPVRWFRPPYGRFSLVSLWHARRARTKTVLWNVDPRDYRAESAGEILARVGPLNAGDVVLLHDRSEALVEALPEILARIDDAGLAASSLDQAAAISGARSR